MSHMHHGFKQVAVSLLLSSRCTMAPKEQPLETAQPMGEGSRGFTATALGCEKAVARKRTATATSYTVVEYIV